MSQLMTVVVAHEAPAGWNEAELMEHLTHLRSLCLSKDTSEGCHPAHRQFAKG